MLSDVTSKPVSDDMKCSISQSLIATIFSVQMESDRNLMTARNLGVVFGRMCAIFLSESADTHVFLSNVDEI